MCRVSPFHILCRLLSNNTDDMATLTLHQKKTSRNGPSFFFFGTILELVKLAYHCTKHHQTRPSRIFLQTCRAIVKGLLKKQELRLGLVRVSRHDGKLRCGFVVVGSKGHLSFVLRESVVTSSNMCWPFGLAKQVCPLVTSVVKSAKDPPFLCHGKLASNFRFHH